jgi:hypothetical protein
VRSASRPCCVHWDPVVVDERGGLHLGVGDTVDDGHVEVLDRVDLQEVERVPEPARADPYGA